MNWYLAALKKYAVFSGRARRREYWTFALFNIVIAFVLGLVEGAAGIASGATYSVLATIFSLAVLCPGVAVGVRRLHDIGKSGWWLLVALVPFIGAIVLLLFFLRDSQPVDNQYGPNPKSAAI